MHGKGKLIQADGFTIYEGQFQKGLKHGMGTLTKINESKIKGIWQKDELKNMITYENLKALSDFYMAMRSASEGEGSPIAITARQLESLIRISEARARVALRNLVTAEDAEAAIAIMQRSLSEVGIDVSSYKVDIDIIMTGKPKSVRDKLHVILSVLMGMEKETGIVEKSTLISEVEEKHNIPRTDIERMLSQLLREGTIYEPREGHLKKT